MNASLADVPVPVAVVSPPASPAGTAAGAWPLWHRIGFRYSFVFFVLYVFPSPLNRVLTTITGVNGWLGRTLGWPWLSDAPFRWPAQASGWLQQVAEAEPMTDWMQ